MNLYLLNIILGVAGLLLVLVLYVMGRAKRHGASVAEELAGVCSFVLGQTEEKEKNKKKIIEFFNKKGELSNSDIRKALSVSARTAVNYMDELERENKVEQIGKTGHDVIYKLK